MRSSLLVLAGITLAGCGALGGFELERPGRHEVGTSYAISTSQSWSRASMPEGELWTIDGPSLGRLQTWSSVPNGAALTEVDGRSLPVFRAEYTAIEVAELVADTIEALSVGADVVIEDLRPAPFGSHPGFRFSYRYSDAGLPTRGVALGAVHDRQLDLITFAAPAEHYFELYRPEVERIMTSVTAPL